MTRSELPVAEVVAASVCWLYRWRGGRALANAIEGGAALAQVGFWHRERCRFCDTPLDELLKLADLSRCSPEDLRWWKAQARNVRAAKVYEAQSPPWWEELP